MPFSTLRATMLASTLLLAVSAVTGLSGCCKKSGGEQVGSAEGATPDRTLTERYDDAVVAWAVATDGTVRAALKPSETGSVDKGATLTLTATPASGTASAPIGLVYDPTTGMHAGKIPALTADITEIAYDGTVGGKTLKGVIHVPQGGTNELVESGKAAAGKVPADAKGPNGGVVQVVGPDVVEIAADKGGAVRVYILDDARKPVAVGTRTVKLAVGGPSGEVIELTPDPSGGYFVGKLSLKGNPSKLTVIVRSKPGAAPVVVLCGWNPGTVVVVGRNARPVNLYVVNVWPQTTVVVNPTKTVVVVPGTVVVTTKGKGKGRKNGHYKKGR